VLGGGMWGSSAAEVIARGWCMRLLHELGRQEGSVQVGWRLRSAVVSSVCMGVEWPSPLEGETRAWRAVSPNVAHRVEHRECDDCQGKTISFLPSLP
jgi:hypothetical protein